MCISGDSCLSEIITVKLNELAVASEKMFS